MCLKPWNGGILWVTHLPMPSQTRAEDGAVLGVNGFSRFLRANHPSTPTSLHLFLLLRVTLTFQWQSNSSNFFWKLLISIGRPLLNFPIFTWGAKGGLELGRRCFKWVLTLTGFGPINGGCSKGKPITKVRGEGTHFTMDGSLERFFLLVVYLIVLKIFIWRHLRFG